MAYPQLRSMNGALTEGATDGRYKKIRMDAECSVDKDGIEANTYRTRESLSLPYYGIGEARTMRVPGTNESRTMPDYYPNRFETAEYGPVFGKSW
jgi:hypothetical protein